MQCYSVTCSVRIWVSNHSWLESTLHSVPSSCTLCQPVLIVRTLDKICFPLQCTYVLSKLDCTHTHTHTMQHTCRYYMRIVTHNAHVQTLHQNSERIKPPLTVSTHTYTTIHPFQVDKCRYINTHHNSCVSAPTHLLVVLKSFVISFSLEPLIPSHSPILCFLQWRL